MSLCPILKRNEAQVTPIGLLQKLNQTIVTLVAHIKPTNVVHAPTTVANQRNHRLQVQKAVAQNRLNMAKNLRQKTKHQAKNHQKTRKNLLQVSHLKTRKNHRLQNLLQKTKRNLLQVSRQKTARRKVLHQKHRARKKNLQARNQAAKNLLQSLTLKRKNNRVQHPLIHIHNEEMHYTSPRLFYIIGNTPIGIITKSFNQLISGY